MLTSIYRAKLIIFFLYLFNLYWRLTASIHDLFAFFRVRNCTPLCSGIIDYILLKEIDYELNILRLMHNNKNEKFEWKDMLRIYEISKYSQVKQMNRV